MRKILITATIVLTALCSLAQTEVRTIDKHDYARIDTMWSDYDTHAYRFLVLVGRDTTLSLLDTYRHWMSPKFWKLQDPLTAYVSYLCDNTTTSLFEISNARPGENWLVTLSGDKIVLPSYTRVEAAGYNMMTLRYGGDRFWANRDGYAALKTKAKALFAKIDAIGQWQMADSLGRATYQIDWPNDSSTLSQNVRQWISGQLSACAPEAAYLDTTGRWQPLVIDARMATDSSSVLEGYAKAFLQGLKRDSVSPLMGCFTSLTVLRRTAMKGYVTYSADANWYGGGAHGMSTFTYGTFGRQSGRLLTSADILKSESRKRVSELIADEVDRQRKEWGIYSEPQPLTWESVDGRHDLCDTNIGFLPGGVVFTYQPYDIGSYAEGCYCIVIPWSRISDHLAIVPEEYK